MLAALAALPATATLLLDPKRVTLGLREQVPAAVREEAGRRERNVWALFGLALILGIDRFMSEARSLTNFIGNGVATVVVSRWEGEMTAEELRENLRKPHAPAAEAGPATSVDGD